MSKKIETPEYWNEEWYQPLVEAKTLYGNKVMIPQRFTALWQRMHKMYPSQKVAMDLTIKHLKAGSFNPNSLRGEVGNDLKKVFFEIELK